MYRIEEIIADLFIAVTYPNQDETTALVKLDRITSAVNKIFHNIDKQIQEPLSKVEREVGQHERN
jgi:hypothetical protein